MVTDLANDTQQVTLIGQYPPIREHRSQEIAWEITNRVDMAIGPSDETIPTHTISLIERHKKDAIEDRQVIVHIEPRSSLQSTDSRVTKNIEMPLGDFLQQDYWHSDDLGGRLTLMSHDPIDFGGAVRTLIKKDKGEFAFAWLQEADTHSTYQQAEDHFRGNILNNRKVDIPLSPTQKIYIHTHVCKPTYKDRRSENPYIRNGYRAVIINITEVINPDEPPEKHVFKRIHVSDREKLLPIEFPISEWEKHVEGYRDAIHTKIPRLTESEIDAMFTLLETNIRTLLDIDANSRPSR